MWSRSFAFVLVLASLGSALVAQEKSAAVESTLPALPKSLYFVFPAAKPPAAGKKAGLVVVLPGGDGSREFLPWVENALLAQRPDDCIGVMITSVKWQPDQEIIWPTDSSKVPGMEYTTEQYVRVVTAEIEKATPVDAARRIVVAWSSSGPAIHALLATKDSPFHRAYIAMAIWPQGLDELTPVKGRRYVLDQSPEDQTTIFQHVRTAYAALTKAGAQVRVTTYAGGHGWHDDPLPRIAKGFAWLLSNEPAGKPEWPAAKVAKKDGKLVNLLENGDFEKGTKGWNTVANSKRLKVEVDKKDKVEGKQSLHLSKEGGAPLDLVVQSVELPAGKKVKASLQLQSKDATNAWVKVRLFDAADKVLHDEIDVARVTADPKWQPFQKEWVVEGAVRATVQILMVAGGELWIDDFVLTVEQ
jgi:hypothetical protein